MDQDRIEQALREGPPDEPSYRPGVGGRLTSEVTPESSVGATARSFGADPGFDSGIRPTGMARVGSGAAVTRRLSGAIAAAIVLVVAGFAVRWGQGPAATPEPGDLLARVRTAGVVHVVVTSDAPQVAGVGGTYVGYDVDVANAIAEKLGVRADVRPLTTQEILAAPGTWQVAFPSTDRARVPSGFLVSDSYYAWPSWLVVAGDSGLTSLDQLSGTSICVVDDSAGSDWLAGLTVSGAERQPPERVTAVPAASDAACFAAVAAGEATAAITSASLDTELAAHGVRAIGPDPVLHQARAALIRVDASAQDAASLLGALDDAIADLRASGQLAELSRRAFGGRDLTEIQP